MSKTTADRIALLFAQLPEVKDLIERHESSEREKALTARLACLDSLELHRAKESEAKAAHQSATKALDDVRAKLQAAEKVAFAAYANWTQASGARNHVENELAKAHGEGFVKQAGYILHRSREDAAKLLSNLEANRYIHTSWGTRVERPEVLPRIAEVQEHLSAIALAAEGVAALNEARIPPGDIAEQVDALLASAKCRTLSNQDQELAA